MIVSGLQIRIPVFMLPILFFCVDVASFLNAAHFRPAVPSWAVGASCGRSPGRWDTQPRKEEQQEEKWEEEENKEMEE